MGRVDRATAVAVTLLAITSIYFVIDNYVPLYPWNNLAEAFPLEAEEGDEESDSVPASARWCSRRSCRATCACPKRRLTGSLPCSTTSAARAPRAT